jgi:hypothetical protein
MRDKTDTSTMEIPWLDDLKAGLTANKYGFAFHITTTSGETIEWTGLTSKRAKDMFNATEQAQPTNITGFGWEEIK